MSTITREATVRWGVGSYTLRLEQSTSQAPVATRSGVERQLGELLQLIASNSRFASEVGGLLRLACPVMQGPALSRELWRTPLQQLLASGRLRLLFTRVMHASPVPRAPSAGPEQAVESHDDLPPQPPTQSDKAHATTLLRLFYGVDAKLYGGDVALVAAGDTKEMSGDTARRHDGFIDEARCRPRGITHWHLKDFIQAARLRRLADFIFE